MSIKSLKRSGIVNYVDYKSMLAGNEGFVPFVSDYELISTVFGTGASTGINFTSIPQGYKHLQIRWSSQTVGNSIEMRLTFNDVATNSYSFHDVRSMGQNGTGSSSSNNIGYISLGYGLARSGTDANNYSAGVLDILNYADTTRTKTTRSFHGINEGTTNGLQLSSGAFRLTNAITKITLISQLGNLTTASRFSLYGLRG